MMANMHLVRRPQKQQNEHKTGYKSPARSSPAARVAIAKHDQPLTGCRQSTGLALAEAMAATREIDPKFGMRSEVIRSANQKMRFAGGAHTVSVPAAAEIGTLAVGGLTRPTRLLVFSRRAAAALTARGLHRDADSVEATHDALSKPMHFAIDTPPAPRETDE